VATHGIGHKSLQKPFNPVLGETFEMKSKNYRLLAEQVSHHPPISALHADGKTYELWMNSYTKS
jgi:hypothetical protein